MIDRLHLRYFLSVIDAGNFSRAAAACNVTQPTLSVGIAKLERQLGRPVFQRSNRRVELTDAGVRLAAHARAIEAGFAQAEREVAGTGATRTIRLGILSTIARGWIEEALGRHRAAAAHEQVEIVEGRERDLNERLARGRIDVALTILRDPGHGDALFTEGYMLTLPATHPLAGRATIAAEELTGDAMIVRRHCEVLGETSRFFTARGIRPFFAARTTSDDRVLGYVRAGLGVTVMPERFAADGVVHAHLTGFDATRTVGLVFAPHTGADRLEKGALVAALRDAA